MQYISNECKCFFKMDMVLMIDIPIIFNKNILNVQEMNEQCSVLKGHTSNSHSKLSLLISWLTHPAACPFTLVFTILVTLWTSFILPEEFFF